jgi:hypothetical protein
MNKDEEDLEEKESASKIGKKKRFTRKKRFTKDKGNSTSVAAYNDPSWWFQDPAMARDAASIWCTQRLGSKTPDQFGGSESSPFKIKSSISTAGIMRINFVPTYGTTGPVSDDGVSRFDTSAINTAASKVYWDVVHANSRNIQYDPSDLMMLFINMDNIYMMIMDAIRAYAYAKRYSMDNVYYGRALVQAMGWDYDNLIVNLAAFRYKLNTLINLVNRIHVPRIYNIFAAHINLVDRVFCDAPKTRAQLYVMVADGHYEYDDANGKIEWKAHYTTNSSGQRGTTHSVKNFAFLNTIETQINAVINSTWMGVMDGDILKRYGEGSMFTLPSIPEELEAVPVFDQEFQFMIRNSDFIGPRKQGVRGGALPSNNLSVTISHATSNVSRLEIRTLWTQYLPNDVSNKTNYPTNLVLMMARSRVIPLCDQRIIDFPDEVDITPEVVMLATRATFTIASELSETRQYYPSSAGNITEITRELSSVGTMVITHFEMYYTNPTSLNVNEVIYGDFTAIRYEVESPGAKPEEDNSYRALLIRAQAAQFKYLPRLEVHYIFNATPATNLWIALDDGAIDNFGFISYEQIQRLNYVAVNSIFTEASVGGYGTADRE